jgi:hypothetical protein
MSLCLTKPMSKEAFGFEIHDHVTRIVGGQAGKIMAFHGDLAVVLWGIQDGNTYEDEIPLTELTHTEVEDSKPIRRNIFEKNDKE